LLPKVLARKKSERLIDGRWAYLPLFVLCDTPIPRGVCVFASIPSFYSLIDNTFFPQLVHIHAIPAFDP
jgi:hypothetical protein